MQPNGRYLAIRYHLNPRGSTDCHRSTLCPRCHASPNLQARQNPNNDPTVRVYQHLEDQLAKAGSDTEDILALTTTREGATNLRNYFSIADKKANAETAVKVAGATAKHCIVIHGVSTFLSGEGRHLDYDQECFTRANVAYSRDASDQREEGSPDLQTSNVFAAGMVDKHTASKLRQVRCASTK